MCKPLPSFSTHDDPLALHVPIEVVDAGPEGFDFGLCHELFAIECPHPDRARDISRRCIVPGRADPRNGRLLRVPRVAEVGLRAIEREYEDGAVVCVDESLAIAVRRKAPNNGVVQPTETLLGL